MPFQMYQDFVDHPPNDELRAALAEPGRRPSEAGTSRRWTAPRGWAMVQAAFLAAAFPPDALARLRTPARARCCPGSRR